MIKYYSRSREELIELQKSQVHDLINELEKRDKDLEVVIVVGSLDFDEKDYSRSRELQKSQVHDLINELEKRDEDLEVLIVVRSLDFDEKE